VAAWMRHVVDPRDAAGRPAELRDPLSATLRAAIGDARTPREQASRLLGVRRVFPDDIDPVFGERVVAAHHALATEEPRSVLRRALDGTRLGETH
jgi:mannitol-1-phosphate/altronate dehydrogenase